MSDQIKHECGFVLIRLRKPLEYYKEKYGSWMYGLHKLYLLMEKQHNRGQDGAGVVSLKLDQHSGTKYLSRKRSNKQNPIKDVFKGINEAMVKHIFVVNTVSSNVKPRVKLITFFIFYNFRSIN